MPVIKITNKQLMESMDAITAVQAIDWNTIKPENRQKLKRWMREIRNHVDDVLEGRQSLMHQNWATDKETQAPTADFKPANQIKFDRETKTFLAESVEINVPRLKIELLGEKSKLNVGQIVALDWWLEPDVDEKAAEEE